MLIVGAAWGAGLGMAQREHRASHLPEESVTLRHERDSAAALAASEERARIARELHDVISHHVSVMVLQAGAAGEVIDGDPGRARDSLEAIQVTGGQALVELRRLLGVSAPDRNDKMITLITADDQALVGGGLRMMHLA